MHDERVARRPGFRDGYWVSLSDGSRWMLPDRAPNEIDGEFDALLRAVHQSEDRNEQLLGELALTIFLLTKNYQLCASELQSLLRFDPEDPALARLQNDVHSLVVASLAKRPKVAELPNRSWSLGWFSGRRHGDSRVSSHPSTPVA